MSKIDLKEAQEIKEHIVKSSKKGFGYFIKNLAMIILIVMMIFIFVNFQTIMTDPSKIITEFTNAGWMIILFLIVAGCGVYQLGKNLFDSDQATKMNDTIYSYKEAEKIVEEEKRKEHQRNVEKRFENTPKISMILKDLLINLGADRAAIAEMHNGTNNLHGLPFIFFDVTYEETSRKVEYVSDDFKNFNMGKYPFISNHFEEGTWIGSRTMIEEEDNRLALKFKLAEAEYGGAVVIQGIDGPLGFLTVTFKDPDDHPSKTEIIAALNQSSQKISTLLDKVIE